MSDKQRRFHGETTMNTYNVLRKLQQQNRANIPAMMAQRAVSSFSLQQEPPPEEALDTVFVVVYPQNPFVGEPEVRRMRSKDIQSGLINSRVQVKDSRGVLALPDDDGHYLYWVGTPEFDQVNAFYYTTFTLRMYERYARRQIPWSFPSARLKIDPHVGELANAFYNEQEQLLGFHTFLNQAGERHSTAQSADIVTHEVAHAILDGLRDLYNESFGLGGRAFHESFSDVSAILVALHDDSLIRRVLEWTEGDLKMSTFVTEVAEHLTDELNQQSHLTQHTIYLRNAFNQLVDKPFDELPFIPDNPTSELGRQEHNYSRLFTGAVYDILVGIYERFIENNQQPFVALYHARDVIGYLLTMAIEVGPVGELNFADMARAFLTADNILYKGRYHAILRHVFDKRRILSKSDADAHRESLNYLPDLRLPETINGVLAAAIFLEEEVQPTLGISGSETLIPMSTYRNAKGYAFLTYFSSRSILLEGAQFGQYQGVEVDAFGGLTLVFDKYNKLRSVCHRPVTEIDVEQIKVIVAEMINHNKIAEDVYPTHLHLNDIPDGLIIPGQPFGQAKGNKLIKYPVIFDEIPSLLNSLREHFKSWNHKSDS
ncbi:MAG: hypothetical protein ACFE0Q_07190 [Anaerolineae bacterium]